MKSPILIWVILGSITCAQSLRAQAPGTFTFHTGGGITTPLNPTGAYAGVSGNFVAGAGYNLNKRNAIVGEFLWSGLPSNVLVIQPVKLPLSRTSLYSLTVSYRHQRDRIKQSPFGLYVTGGGGWYYRYTTFDKSYEAPPGTSCLPVYTWWGYGCDPDGYVYTQTIAKAGRSAGGFNGGVGFTIRLSDSDWRFFTESRYHYGFTERVHTTFVPVTMGVRLN